MKTRTLICFAYLCAALTVPTFGAAEAKPTAIATKPPMRAISPEVVTSVNAYLAVAKTGDIEKMAAQVYCENDDQRAQVVAYLQKILHPLAGLTISEASFQVLASLKDPMQEGFTLVYKCSAKDAGKIRTATGVVCILNVNGVWQAAFLPKDSFIQEEFDHVGQALLAAELMHVRAQKQPPLTIALHTQTLGSTQGLSKKELERNTPVLQAAQNIIRAMQAELLAAGKAKLYLFGFEEKEGQLGLLCALPVAGETPLSHPPAVRVRDDMAVAYQLTDVNPANSDAFFFAMIYTRRESPHAYGSRSVAPCRVTLPENTLFPVQILPVWSKSQILQKKPHFHFLLAHLPLTENSQVLPCTAMYERPSKKPTQPPAAKLQAK